MRDAYEIFLLEVRQGIKDTEQQFRNLACVDLCYYKKLIKLKVLVDKELKANSLGTSDKRELFHQIIEG